jgi:hypothetical protein
MTSAARLFHSLVVGGMALGTACGSDVVVGGSGGGGNAGRGAAGGEGGSGGAPFGVGAGGDTNGACPLRCAPGTATVVEDCATSADFHCIAYQPGFSDCCCDARSPDSEAQCSGRFECYSYDPPMGCCCIVVITQ